MNNIFNCIDEIEQVSLDSEVAVLESMLICMDKCVYINEHAENIDEDNNAFKLITESFVMEASDNSKGSGIAAGINSFAKKIGAFISKLFKRNPGKIDGVDSAGLARDVDRVSKGGSTKGGCSTWQKLAIGAGVATVATGVMFTYDVHRKNKENKAGEKDWDTLRYALSAAHVDKKGNITFEFTMDLKTFDKTLEKNIAGFQRIVDKTIEMRKKNVSSVKNVSGSATNDFTKKFMNSMITDVDKELSNLGQCFKELYKSYDADGKIKMSLDEWNEFCDRVSKNCTTAGDLINRLDLFMPSHNNANNFEDKKDKIIADMKKTEAGKQKPGESDIMYNKRIEREFEKLYGKGGKDEFEDNKVLFNTLRNKENSWNAQATHTRNNMSELYNDFNAFNQFMLDVKGRVKEAHQEAKDAKKNKK